MNYCEVALRSLSDFRMFLAGRPDCMDKQHIRSIAERIRARGTVRSRRLGDVPVVIEGDNCRQAIQVRGIPSSSLAMLDLLDLHTGRNSNARILCMESLTDFARLLKEIYPAAVCSEYAPDPEVQRRIAPVPHVDAMNMQFDDNTFNAIISSDVFEYLPGLDQALTESRRVLRPCGVLIATFPFAYMQNESIQKAVMEDGVIRYLMAPEHQVDPVHPEKGVVFQIPGWDILDRCTWAGFSGAEMVYLADERRGFMASELEGLFILRAYR